jgi:hypothetical protein
MYSYSVNDEENFKGEFDTIEEAIESAKIEAEESDYEIGDTVTLYTGKNVYPFDVLADYDICYHLLERLDDVVYDAIHFDDGEFLTLPEDKQKELNSLILSYLKEHATYPKYFTVENITECEYTITGEW